MWRVFPHPPKTLFLQCLDMSNPKINFYNWRRWSSRTVWPIKILKWCFSILSWSPSFQTFFAAFINFGHIQSKNEAALFFFQKPVKMEVLIISVNLDRKVTTFVMPQTFIMAFTMLWAYPIFKNAKSLPLCFPCYNRGEAVI